MSPLVGMLNITHVLSLPRRPLISQNLLLLGGEKVRTHSLFTLEYLTMFKQPAYVRSIWIKRPPTSNVRTSTAYECWEETTTNTSTIYNYPPFSSPSKVPSGLHTSTSDSKITALQAKHKLRAHTNPRRIQALYTTTLHSHHPAKSRWACAPAQATAKSRRSNHNVPTRTHDEYKHYIQLPSTLIAQ